jgi:hypothetical protein
MLGFQLNYSLIYNHKSHNFFYTTYMQFLKGDLSSNVIHRYYNGDLIPHGKFLHIRANLVTRDP